MAKICFGVNQGGGGRCNPHFSKYATHRPIPYKHAHTLQKTHGYFDASVEIFKVSSMFLKYGLVKIRQTCRQDIQVEHHF